MSLFNREGKENVSELNKRIFGFCDVPREGEWCRASEMRLKLKLAQHRPIGANRHYQLMMLATYLNNVYEDEDDINHDDFLTRADLRHHRSQTKAVQQSLKRGELPRVVAAEEHPSRAKHAYCPSYAIRPSVGDIEKKLAEWFNMAALNENEEEPEGLQTESEFVLNEASLSPNAGTSAS